MSGRFEGNFDRIERAIESALNPTAIAFAKAANQYVKKTLGQPKLVFGLIVISQKENWYGVQSMLGTHIIGELHLKPQSSSIHTVG